MKKGVDGKLFNKNGTKRKKIRETRKRKSLCKNATSTISTQNDEQTKGNRKTDEKKKNSPLIFNLLASFGRFIFAFSLSFSFFSGWKCSHTDFTFTTCRFYGCCFTVTLTLRVMCTCYLLIALGIFAACASAFFISRTVWTKRMTRSHDNFFVFTFTFLFIRNTWFLFYFASFLAINKTCAHRESKKKNVRATCVFLLLFLVESMKNDAQQ